MDVEAVTAAVQEAVVDHVDKQLKVLRTDMELRARSGREAKSEKAKSAGRDAAYIGNQASRMRVLPLPLPPPLPCPRLSRPSETPRPSSHSPSLSPSPYLSATQPPRDSPITKRCSSSPACSSSLWPR